MENTGGSVSTVRMSTEEEVRFSSYFSYNYAIPRRVSPLHLSHDYVTARKNSYRGVHNIP